jgi:glycosyltransferase involved in cell wall biosynthesis
MRLLVVGFADSIHIARYLDLLQGSEWDVHLFTSSPGSEPHPELPPVTLHFAGPMKRSSNPSVRIAPAPTVPPASFEDHVDYLARVIDEIRPDIVHSHEIQHAGVVVEAALRRSGTPRPPWLVTNWGSDILWWGRHRDQVRGIIDVLSTCDYYGAECHRDIALGRAFGFRGKVVGVWPVAGGVDLGHAATLRAPGPTSARRAISVKGAVSDVGRGEVAFEAITRCIDLVEGWEICSYQMHPSLSPRYAKLAERAGFTYTELSNLAAQQSPHDALLAMHGRSRVSVALNRTDALSTSFLEAMALGSFPVQSNGSCAGEITPDGRGAIFVPADDADAVTAALRRALTDDRLVDAAAEINARVAAEHLDRRRTRARVLDAYERIVCDAALARSG